MRYFRRVPPLLRVLWLLGVLAILASLGIYIWVALMVRGHLERVLQQLLRIGLALLELGMAYTWTVTAYSARSARALGTPVLRRLDAMAWLDTRRGQLMSAFVLSALPIAAPVVTLVTPTRSPLFSLAYTFGALSGLVLLAASGWGLILHSRLEEEPGT